jgi:hypothetical protein
MDSFVSGQRKRPTLRLGRAFSVSIGTQNHYGRRDTIMGYMCVESDVHLGEDEVELKL